MCTSYLYEWNTYKCCIMSDSRKKLKLLLIWSNWNAVKTTLTVSMALWGSYPCVRQTTLWKKMTLCSDQGPANRNWFKFLWSASFSSSTSMQTDIPAAPLLFSFFFHRQYHSPVCLILFLLYSLFPYPAVHPSTLLLPVLCTTVSQPTSILALVCSFPSAAFHSCFNHFCSH